MALRGPGRGAEASRRPKQVDARSRQKAVDVDSGAGRRWIVIAKGAAARRCLWRGSGNDGNYRRDRPR